MTSQGPGIYTFHRLFRVQGGTGTYERYIDAHEIAEKDFNVVTRERQTFDKTQLWQLVPKGGNIFEIMQVSSGRFMDAHEIPAMNYRVVTPAEAARPDPALGGDQGQGRRLEE